MLYMDSGPLQEDKCSETGESALHCSQCNVPVQGFESFTTHLKSSEHAYNVSCVNTFVIV